MQRTNSPILLDLDQASVSDQAGTAQNPIVLEDGAWAFAAELDQENEEDIEMARQFADNDPLNDNTFSYIKNLKRKYENNLKQQYGFTEEDIELLFSHKNCVAHLQLIFTEDYEKLEKLKFTRHQIIELIHTDEAEKNIHFLLKLINKRKIQPLLHQEIITTLTLGEVGRDRIRQNIDHFFISSDVSNAALTHLKPDLPPEKIDSFESTEAPLMTLPEIALHDTETFHFNIPQSLNQTTEDDSFSWTEEAFFAARPSEVCLAPSEPAKPVIHRDDEENEESPSIDFRSALRGLYGSSGFQQYIEPEAKKCETEKEEISHTPSESRQDSTILQWSKLIEAVNEFEASYRTELDKLKSISWRDKAKLLHHQNASHAPLIFRCYSQMINLGFKKNQIFTIIHTDDAEKNINFLEKFVFGKLEIQSDCHEKIIQQLEKGKEGRNRLIEKQKNYFIEMNQSSILIQPNETIFGSREKSKKRKFSKIQHDSPDAISNQTEKDNALNKTAERSQRPVRSTMGHGIRFYDGQPNQPRQEHQSDSSSLIFK